MQECSVFFPPQLESPTLSLVPVRCSFSKPCFFLFSFFFAVCSFGMLAATINVPPHFASFVLTEGVSYDSFSFFASIRKFRHCGCKHTVSVLNFGSHHLIKYPREEKKSKKSSLTVVPFFPFKYPCEEKKSKKSTLTVVPFFLCSIVLSFIIQDFFVPGSRIDAQYDWSVIYTVPFLPRSSLNEGEKKMTPMFAFFCAYMAASLTGNRVNFERFVHKRFVYQFFISLKRPAQIHIISFIAHFAVEFG